MFCYTSTCTYNICLLTVYLNIYILLSLHSFLADCIKLFKQTNNYKESPVIKGSLHQINLNHCEKVSLLLNVLTVVLELSGHGSTMNYTLRSLNMCHNK